MDTNFLSQSIKYGEQAFPKEKGKSAKSYLQHFGFYKISATFTWQMYFTIEKVTAQQTLRHLQLSIRDHSNTLTLE